MAKNEEDLIRRTLSILGKVQVGQPLEAHDVELVRSLIPSVLADLHRQRAVTIEDSNSIDNELLNWVALYASQYVAPDFGLPISADTMALAIRMINLVTHEQPYYFVQRATHF